MHLTRRDILPFLVQTFPDGVRQLSTILFGQRRSLLLDAALVHPALIDGVRDGRHAGIDIRTFDLHAAVEHHLKRSLVEDKCCHDIITGRRPADGGQFRQRSRALEDIRPVLTSGAVQHRAVFNRKQIDLLRLKAVSLLLVDESHLVAGLGFQQAAGRQDH